MGRTPQMEVAAIQNDRHPILVLIAAEVVPVPSGLETALIHPVGGAVPKGTEPRLVFAPGDKGSTGAHAGVSLSAFGHVAGIARMILLMVAVTAPNELIMST